MKLYHCTELPEDHISVASRAFSQPSVCVQVEADGGDVSPYLHLTPDDAEALARDIIEAAKAARLAQEPA